MRSRLSFLFPRLSQLLAAFLLCSPSFAAHAQLWSLQPVKSPSIPEVKNTGWPRNPIDHFVLAKLEAKGLTPAAEANKAILIRRLSFDLIGLPPAPEEIDAFVSDESAGAWERVVERLLSSPRYGERWARHWLDVVRYTESQGFEYDRLRENAWPYRDYVIASFNRDKPYDRFVREQIAGDVLGATPELKVATSLLVCGAWDEAGNKQANATQRAITREEELEDLVSVVCQSFIGLTVNCARCHAHKFDPIPQEDYYRIKSVFEGVRHGDGVIATPDEIRQRDGAVKEVKARIARLEKELASAPAAERPRITAELDQNQNTLKNIPPLAAAYMGVREQPAPTRRLKRGDVKSPEEEVAPGALSCVPELRPDFGLRPDAPEAQRRLKFADWMADVRNPLTPRVIVNRIWQYHFGRGLVATPNDFGNSGAAPSHPELLDWLASEFIRSGWSVKALHRLIVNSATYRESSELNRAAAELDADNQWLGRFSPHRLEAEAIRDAILAASGEINFFAGGPSFRPFDVIQFNSSTYLPVDKQGAAFHRRTVYRMNVNSGKEPLLDAFDCPDPSVKTPRRGVTTTPLQALLLMNDSFVQRQANALARRGMHDASDLPAAVARVYQLALGRLPRPGESQRALDAARERGLSHVCWALFNSTEFLYVQ